MLDNYTRFFGNFVTIKDELDNLRFYLSELELFIEYENNKLANIDPDFGTDPMMYNRKFQFENTMERTLRCSIIISIVTIIEVDLQNFCSELKNALSLELKFSDFKGTILEQFKIYCNKVCFLNIDFGKDEFQSLKELIELRNCIVHYDGQIEDFYGRKFSRAEVIKTLGKKITGIKIEETDFISIDKNGCEQCVAIVESFLDLIYQSAFNKFPK